MFLDDAEADEKKGSFKRLVKTMKKGYNLGFNGKKVYEKRAELYSQKFKDATSKKSNGLKS